MIKDLRDARLVDAVPRVVAGQDWVRALSEAVGVLHERTLRYIDDSQIYTSLDTATEPVLDALAEGGENTEGMSRETVTRTPEPLDTEDVTLYLFAIDGIMIH